MPRSEPFRGLFEEARAAEPPKAPTTPRPAPLPPAPMALAQRLDQVSLAGGTPARGTVVPPLEAVRERPTARSAPTRDLLAALDQVHEEQTRPLPAGSAIDAALRDSLAELDATVEIPAQRRIAAREVHSANDAPRAPAPVTLKPLTRPPPLPPGKAKAAPPPVATRAPPPVLSEAAPPPRVLQLLGEENTIPGLMPGSRSSSSDKVIRQSDLYRLQLEFEDTPARPLPRFAHVPPPPLPASARNAPRKPGAAAPLTELRDLETIQDLQAMARALGLDGVGDVSIPSLEGLPVLDERIEDAALPALSGLPEAGGPDDLFDDLFDDFRLDDFALTTPPRVTCEVRRALVLEALDNSIETVFPERRSTAEGAGGARPALAPSKAVTPVIVKIPSSPKVSLEDRERARQLYLDAVDLLGKGDRKAAIKRLRRAVERDDGIPLYRDLLAQLEAPARSEGAEDGPALTVLGPLGQRSKARDHWRSARPR